MGPERAAGAALPANTATDEQRPADVKTPSTFDGFRCDFNLKSLSQTYFMLPCA